MIELKVPGTLLVQLKEEFSGKRVQKTIAAEVGLAAIHLHRALSFAVVQTYNSPVQLDSVLLDKSSSMIKFGQNVIKGELRYKDSALMLSRFITNVYKGNIEPVDGKKREGWVHEVMIRRPNSKISYGKYGFGGFSPRGADGKIRYGKYGKNIMLERLTEKKYPVKLMYGPSVAKMAEQMWEKDPGVQKAKLESEQMILDALGKI